MKKIIYHAKYINPKCIFCVNLIKIGSVDIYTATCEDIYTDRHVINVYILTQGNPKWMFSPNTKNRKFFKIIILSLTDAALYSLVLEFVLNVI